ncbi:MAG: phosphoribosyl 1,2-cyclic phosphodiesterase/FixJ family two-component response regulator [Verrucomicrobiales bacterium]|jgi:phosphoribosyl 1,2-cyclic phosphodiesterase/FixJ family two-component response regulator
MHPESEPKRVLVVEDVRAISHTLATILRSEGFQVEVAEDGEAGLAKIAEFRPHLVLLDLLLPKMHGMDVLRQLRAMPDGDQTGVILSTTKDFTTERRIGEELGVFDYLEKPASREALIGSVNRFFGSPPPLEKAPESAAAAAPRFEPVLDSSRGVIRFLGTRGSIPVSGPAHCDYGGNTTCMQFDLGPENDVVIFDAGSGIRELGGKLAGEGANRPIHLFMTHTHWDHIQGFPFFAPIYFPNAKITIYGDKGFGENLESVFRGQFGRDYFPVQWEDFRAQVDFVYLDDNPIEVAGMTISREYVNHPGATIGYKIAYQGRTTVFIPDNEFIQGYLGPPDQPEYFEDLLATHHKVIEFIKGADVLIHEAQYPQNEYPNKVGWGHSSVSNACILVSRCGVKEWFIPHHDPAHDDLFLDQKLALTQQLLASLSCDTRVSHAKDGLAKYL